LVEIDQTEHENDSWLAKGHRKPRNIIYYLITVVEDDKDIMNYHGSRRIEHLFLVSRKFFFCKITPYGSRLEITIHKENLAISHFMGKKRADHESQKYPLPPSLMRHFQTIEWFQ